MSIGGGSEGGDSGHSSIGSVVRMSGERDGDGGGERANFFLIRKNSIVATPNVTYSSWSILFITRKVYFPTTTFWLLFRLRFSLFSFFGFVVSVGNPLVQEMCV